MSLKLKSKVTPGMVVEFYPPPHPSILTMTQVSNDDLVRDKSPAKEAADLVGGARQSAYGHPLDNMERTAQIFGAILGVPVTAEQAALCMVGLKLARECNKHTYDNIVDIAGYAEVLWMVIEERERRASTG